MNGAILVRHNDRHEDCNGTSHLPRNCVGNWTQRNASVADLTVYKINSVYLHWVTVLTH